MIKICFLLGGFQGNGGIGRVTSVLANNFCQDTDMEVHTISYVQKQEPLLYDIDARVHTHVLYTAPCSMATAMLLRNAVRMVRHILKKEEIDLLIACGALYYPLGIISCKKTKTKCICWEHTNPAVSSDYKFQNLCRSYGANYCSQMVVLTKSAEEYYRQHYPKCSNKLIQIYNPIAENVGCSDRYDINTKRIISVGRLSYPKNFERLITIAARVLPQYPDWSWDIYGDGEARETLQMLIAENGLENQLVLKGQVSDLYDRYREYAFMVMTSRYEGFPMSLIEGAANRLPLISFDIPTGPNEIIIDGVNGYLIDPNSDAEMEEKIKCLIEDASIRSAMSEMVYQLTDTFGMKGILHKWKTLCEQEI